ncbi:MAG: hypothetical protein IKH02_11885, partial [Prevotella sp.]|nr:hypothetical protein [Prevotella sp.]
SNAIKFEIDGSKFTKNLDLSAETWNSTEISGGSGTDELTVKTNLAAAASAGYTVAIDSGDGKDTVILNAASALATTAGAYITFEIDGYSKGTDKIGLTAAGTNTKLKEIDWTTLKNVESLDELAGKTFALSAGEYGFILDSNAYLLIATTDVAAGLAANEGYLIKLAGVKDSADVAASDFYTA